ncbi:MAG: hypothetical protein COB46_07910 [Rhodospirillaceae bacterium]|nr:MAG: hypothetical protein COB46_07910 [Rhodospirillaceae bacterium]
MNNELNRKDLKQACIFFGGIRGLSRLTGINAGNISKWFNGQSTLSDEKVSVVLNALGFQDGSIDTDHVHSWILNKVINANLQATDLTQALKLYFPKGAKIAKAPWAIAGLKTFKRTIKGNAPPPAIYAITDGQTRVVLHLKANLILHKGNIKSHLKWRDGSEAKSILNITENHQVWIENLPSIQEFDAVWNNLKTTPTLDDVNTSIQSEGISFEEAIKRIRQNQP